MNNYAFLALEHGTMKQGRVQAGRVRVMNEHAYDGTGWQEIRVVADKTHFRGYAGGKMVGRGAEPDPGPVGLRLDGTGTVLLGEIVVTSMRS